MQILSTTICVLAKKYCISKCIFLIENIWISYKISLHYIDYAVIDNKLALVQIMAQCQMGDKPLCEPMNNYFYWHIYGLLSLTEWSGYRAISQIAKFMGPKWGPTGSCQPEMGPTLAPWSLLPGYTPCCWNVWRTCVHMLMLQTNYLLLSVCCQYWPQNSSSDLSTHLKRVHYIDK